MTMSTSDVTDHDDVIAALESGQPVPGWDPDNSDRIAEALPPTTTVYALTA